MTRLVYKEHLLQNVIPAIYRAIPHRTTDVILQHDNARPHLLASDPDIIKACHKYRRRITIVEQPSNSPDFNILDLGFFRAIQTLQYKTCPKTKQELINAAIAAYTAFSPQKLNENF